MWGHDMMSGAHGFWMLIWAVVLVVPFWRISQRAGFSGLLSLLMLVPLVNLAYLYFLAFASWPVEQKKPADEGESRDP